MKKPHFAELLARARIRRRPEIPVVFTGDGIQFLLPFMTRRDRWVRRNEK